MFVSPYVTTVWAKIKGAVHAKIATSERRPRATYFSLRSDAFNLIAH